MATTGKFAVLLLTVVTSSISAFRIAPLSYYFQQNNDAKSFSFARDTSTSATSAATTSLETEGQPTITLTNPLSIEYKRYGYDPAPVSPQLRQHQLHSARVSSSFIPSSFSPPVPSILTNRHIQTIGGFFLRNLPHCAYYRDGASTFRSVVSSLFDRFQTPIENNNQVYNHHKPEETATFHSPNFNWYYDHREIILTPDSGAFFTVDHKYTADASSAKGTVIIVHGLESNSNSSLCMDMADAFHRNEYNVDVIHFRGCCGTDVNELYSDGTLIRNEENPFTYHLGFVDDLIYYLGILSERDRESTVLGECENDRKPIFLSGFSLGANVILKALGQIGLEAVEKYGVVGAAVSGAPFDTERSYLQLHRDPVSRLVYVDSLLKKMKERTKEMIKVYYNGDVESAAFDFVASMKASTIYEFENAFLAPLFSFDGYLDYYRKTSCGYYLDRICVPTLIVNAKDDPFFDSTYVPWDKVYGGQSGEQDSEGTGHAPIKIVMTEHGGHLGFLFHQANEGNGHDGKGADESDEKKSSWISEELARFIVHAYDATITLQMKQNEKFGIIPMI